MKYIRTKDGIYETKTIHFPPRFGKTNTFYEENKFADTIEELCDEFVINSEDYKGHLLIHNVIELDNCIFDGIRTLKKHYAYIYGAIWTDKGLIYVAKMNDKGELELL